MISTAVDEMWCLRNVIQDVSNRERAVSQHNGMKATPIHELYKWDVDHLLFYLDFLESTLRKLLLEGEWMLSEDCS